MVKISTKINLALDRTLRDLKLEKKIPNLKPAIRLNCRILFEGKSVPEIAIVDTGAHISLIPFQIWKDLNVEVITKHQMSGVVPDKKIIVNVGYIKAKLIDEEGNESKWIKFLSYFAFTDKVNLLLGFRDILERFNLHVSFEKHEAYLEEFGLPIEPRKVL